MTVMDQGYTGPGMWVQITHRFGPRMMEWFMSLHLTVFGAVLYGIDGIFDQPAWSFHRSIGISPTFLGSIFIVIGVLRFGGLIVNGARRDVTPRIRQFSAGVGCLLWSGITYSFIMSDVVSTWIAIYPFFALAELVNIHRAAHDEGEARNGHRKD